MNKKSSESPVVTKPTRKLCIFLDLGEVIQVAWNLYAADFDNLTDYSFNVVGDTFKQVVYSVCRNVLGHLKDKTLKSGGDYDFAMQMATTVQQIMAETGVSGDDKLHEQIALKLVHGIEEAFLNRMFYECPVVYNDNLIEITDFSIGTIVDDPEHLTAIIHLLV
jgi:hypothetical protein